MIAFKIVPFRVDTQLHMMLSLFCKAVEDLHCFCFHIFYRHKMGSFEH